MIELNTISKIPNDKDIIVKYGYNRFKNYYIDCELKHKTWWNENIKDDWVIIDAGANVGIFSILFARKAKKVYSFEPCLETVEILKKNIIENSVEENKIEIIPLPLSDHCKLKQDIVHHIWEDKPLNQEFQFITIDKFINDKKINVNAIKIDVDSYDYEVLKGTINTIKTQKPIIVIEIVNSALKLRGFSHEDIFKFMNEVNYKFVLAIDSDNYLFQSS